MRRSRPRLAAALTAAALIVGCSSSVGGSAAPQSAVPAPSPSSLTAASSSHAPASAPSSGSARPTRPSPATSPPPTAALPNPATQEPDGAKGTIGYAGIGDPYYPSAGNGGYQVDSYQIDLDYDPATNHLKATARIKATVTSDEGLTQFDLDLQPSMRVTSVRVDDAEADFNQQGAELVIRPALALDRKAAMVIDVGYGGQPTLIPGGTAGLGDGGWYRTQAGGALAAGQPFSASAWYPVNEHPADQATFEVTATVPKKWQVISNGVRQTAGLPDPGPGRSVFRWKITDPIASYLTTIYIDPFTVVTDALDDGTPIVSALGPSALDERQLAEDTKRVIEVLSGYFGPYPYDAAGGIYTGGSLGYSLETATRPVFDRSVDLDTLVHEQAHQWFGDDVAVERWSDICLNECFASYAPWLWYAEVNGVDLDAYWKSQMARLVDDRQFWKSPLVDMGPGKEFTKVYTRGPLALHALRREIGDEAFLALLRGWPATYGGKNASFDDLEAYVTKLAGRDLRPFMHAWFRGTTVPAAQYRYPGDLGN